MGEDQKRVELLNVYSEVFDELGNIKNCGRDVCIKLITLCEAYDTRGIYFGNKATGVMEVEVIIDYITNFI